MPSPSGLTMGALTENGVTLLSPSDLTLQHSLLLNLCGKGRLLAQFLQDCPFLLGEQVGLVQTHQQLPCLLPFLPPTIMLLFLFGDTISTETGFQKIKKLNRKWILM